jgi:HEAT repeat protein
VRDGALPAVQRREALAALGTVSAPTSDAVAETRLAAHSTDADLRSTGTLALGSQAHGLADDNTAASRSIVDELVAMWKAATTTSDQVLALQSLSNTRDPRLVPIVEEALALADQTVRDAAVRALHGIGGDSVDTLIGRVLRQDPAPLPRRGAAACIGARDVVAFLPDLGYALQHDAESMVRLEIVNTLAGAAATSNPVRSLLQTVAAGDATKSVRDAARDILASRSVGADADATP